MHDHQLYLSTLSDFARTLLAPYDVHSTLHQLTLRITDVLGLLGSGVSLAEGDRLVFDAGVGDRVGVLEQMQQDTQVGPCVEAFRTGQVVAVADLRLVPPDRWPAYCRAAERLDVRAVASIPMWLGDQKVGALDLYNAEVRAWEEDDMAAAQVMADMATGYLINASKHRQQQELSEQLQHALTSRVLIEQAKGMVAARHGITPETAFERLRGHARRNGATLGDVAHAVVHLGLDVE